MCSIDSMNWRLASSKGKAVYVFRERWCRNHTWIDVVFNARGIHITCSWYIFPVGISQKCNIDIYKASECQVHGLAFCLDLCDVVWIRNCTYVVNNLATNLLLMIALQMVLALNLVVKSQWWCRLFYRIKPLSDFLFDPTCLHGTYLRLKLPRIIHPQPQDDVGDVGALRVRCVTCLLTNTDPRPPGSP